MRKDFLATCAYCERTEEYLGGEEAFEVEHFKPKGKFPGLICMYDNLYYVCRKCNAHKWETWPSDEQLAWGERFADPCSEDPYAQHLKELQDGSLEALTSCGIYSNRHIRLDRHELQRWRRLRAEARTDIPRLTDVAQMLERLLVGSDGQEWQELQERLAAIRRRIEESKLRFRFS